MGLRVSGLGLRVWEDSRKRPWCSKKGQGSFLGLEGEAGVGDLEVLVTVNCATHLQETRIH